MQFVRRHLTLVGLCAMLAPLVVLVALQYQALSRLEETSPAARRASIEARLQAVSDHVDRTLMQPQLAALAVDPRAVVPGVPDDDMSVFRSAPADGVKRYFIAARYVTPSDGKQHSKVTGYDPATGTIDNTWESPELWAEYSASTHALNLAMERTVVDPNALEFDEKDPNNRVVMKPIVDSESRIVGVAGFIVDAGAVASRTLPTALDAALHSHFSETELSELAVYVVDEGGAARCCGEQGASPALEVSVPMPFAFSKWKLGVSSRGATHEQTARRYFAVNLTLTILMTAILAGAVALTLRAASRELRLSEMKTDFVSNVSHELRTPLASIRVFGELMRKGRITELEKVVEYGELIESESSRLSRLVDNILDFARIESGRKVFSFAVVDPASLVGDAIVAFAPQARQAGFVVDYDAPREPLPSVRVDAAAVSQAIMNLLDNAVKYSGECRRVAVALRSDGDTVAISVTDQGIGIPDEELDRIFTRFHRVSSSLVHDVKGSGLGLALVKHVVDAHGGTVSVRSAPGEGSSFEIRLVAVGRPQGRAGSRVEAESAAAGDRDVARRR